MLNESEYNKILELVKEKVDKNPYDKEVRELLMSLEKRKSEILTYEERIKGEKLIDVFYKIGIYSSKDPSNITYEEMQKSIEYMVLVKEYKDATNNLIKLFSDKDNSESTIREISQEILGIGFSIGKLI